MVKNKSIASHQSSKNLKTLLKDKFSSLKVLVIGDLILDHYIWGDVTRISPEAPVPVVGVERESYVPGGAANVACNLAGLGVQTTLFGRYKLDEGGKRLKALLSERGIYLPPNCCSNKAATIVKTRVVAQRQQVCRIDRELLPEVYQFGEELTSEIVAELVEGFHAIIVSDYAKGVIGNKLLDLLRSSKELGDSAPSSKFASASPLFVLDPKPKRQLELSGFDLMTPNRTEALQLAGLRADPHAPFDDGAVCERIYERFAPKNLVVTMGADGMLLCRDGVILGRLPTEAREVFDVSGAGDTVVATITAALASGQDLKAAARLANKAAGIVVSHLGTSPISARDLHSSKI